MLDAALRHEETGVVAVVGPPGIGKSRLLAAVAERAAADGAVVLRGRAAEFEEDLPFAVWIDALDDHLRALPGDDAEELGGEEVAVALAGVMPAVAARGGAGGRSLLLDERHRVHAAMRTLLERLGRERPLLLMLDDLHWADDGSVDLVASLLRRPPHGLAGIVVALRPGQAAPRLTAALDRAERDGGLARIALGELDAAACDALLGDGLDAAVRRRIREESGGNPFYLQQLARTAGERGVPRGVMEAIEEELRAASPSARLLLEGAAVVGDPFDLGLARAAAELSEPETTAGLDELVRRDLVRVAPDERRFAMRHPLVRRAVYEASGAGWRWAAHARVAEALRRQGAGPALLAHHVARSAEPGDRDAVAVLRSGAAEVLDAAPAPAATWLRGALELLDGASPSAAERLEVLEPLVTALWAIGALEEAQSRLEEARALLPAEAWGRRAALAIASAQIQRRLGRHEAAHQQLATLLAQIPAERELERLPVLTALAGDRFYASDMEALFAWSNEARALAEQVGDPVSLFAATATLAMGAVMVDEIERGDALWREAAEQLDALGDDQLADVLEPLHFLGLAGMYLERFAAICDHAQRAIDAARLHRRWQAVPTLTLTRGYGLAMLGRLEESAALFDDAVEAARIDGAPFALAWVLMNASLVSLFRGDLARTIAECEEAKQIVAAVDDNVATVQIGLVLADALAEVGNWERAAEEALAAGGGPEIATIHGFWRCYSLDLLCRIELARGNRAEAGAAADRALAQGERLQLSLARSWGERAQAAVLLHDGDAAAAAARAIAAAEELERGDSPVEAARTRTLAGRALATAGRREEAIEQLERAVAVCDARGAAGYRAQASRELRRLGRRPARGEVGAAGVASLSGREREVAELVAAGQTNTQIAAALYLSPKTIETHMRNIFAKLRVSSRLEVARAIDAEQGT